MTGTGPLVGLLAGAAVAFAAGPRAAAVAVARRTSAPWVGAHVPHPGFQPRRSAGDRGDARLAAALVEVAALLRAGASPAEAWSRVLRIPVTGRVPTVPQLASLTGAARRARVSPGPPLKAVVAAARVADELGAPLASVLDQVAAAIAAQAEAAADVDAALAGPRSSARVLGWLPALGVVLGMALGADPLGVLLGGGLGTVAGVAGIVLVLVGRGWSNALLRRATRAGSSS